MPSEATNQATVLEWRKLGFYYDRDDQAKVWRLTGSRAGLLRFRDTLMAYVADPRNASPSEHEHYGPYGYLEVMTWPEPGFDGHSIRGSLEHLARLAGLIESKIALACPGSHVLIRDEFATDSPYALVLDLREDGFDPAAADCLLNAEDACFPKVEDSPPTTGETTGEKAAQLAVDLCGARRKQDIDLAEEDGTKRTQRRVFLHQD
jgi:hypothetical protein